MPDPSAALAHRIDKLRGTFLTQLPGRLDDAGRIVADLVAGRPEADRITLRRLFHSIRGTGNSFGFCGLAPLVQACETCLEAETGPWLTLAGAFADLRAYASTLKPDGTPAPAGACGDPAPKPAAPQLPGRPPSGLVYICDDDQMQASLIGNQLGYFGYRTRLFHRTSDLREAVLAQAPDVVVMDIMFPEGACGGTEVLADLRTRQIEVPAVFVSGRSDFEARIQAIRAGGLAYYSKPVEAMDLVGTIDALVHPRLPEPFKILIVDDEKEAAEYHQALLAAAGMTVEVVHRPETVLTAVTDFRPDLVLMDIHMPGCSGPEVAALIRQIPEFLSLPIVYLSAETDKQKQFSALKVGAEGFLTKPVQPQELVDTVALRAERMRTLHSLMTRDSLTGLYNHTTTTQLLGSCLEVAHRSGQPLSFVMIDLDRFKAVNDTWGHPVGDQVLLAVSRVLRQRLRTTDYVGRYGGEEFAVILNNVDAAGAVRIMDSIREDFSRILFPSGDQTFSCTFSCGIAAKTAHSRPEELRVEADKNLYRAKVSGRNRVVADEEIR